MARPRPPHRLTADDYLAWEAEQTERHEYIDGEVFAMAGAEDRHVTVSGNLYMALRHHLRGTRCRTFMSDMGLQVQASNAYFYPNVIGHLQRCGPCQPAVEGRAGTAVRGAVAGHRRLRMCTARARMASGCCIRSVPTMR
ncbi:Uma2 family endonuclease [uncultured Xylophilus sp.]|uniref:Uma2 family endonuclease n=1 Tax=uncultured Xylophilus sp. TaxID=296832 RepID=UPI0025FB5E00|nr:Uma2 family endonuclease [uncultured Xylophilus sp.]